MGHPQSRETLLWCAAALADPTLPLTHRVALSHKGTDFIKGWQGLEYKDDGLPIHVVRGGERGNFN